MYPSEVARRRVRSPAVVGLTPPHPSEVGVVVGDVAQRRSDAFLDGYIHVLSLPGQPLVVEGHEHGGCGVGSGLELGLAEGVFQRLPVVGPENVHQAAQGILDDLRGPVVPVGPGLPEVGNRGHHQPGVDLPQGRVVQTQGWHDPGGKVLHQHVRLPRQFLDNVLAQPGLQVQGDAALTGIEIEEEEALFRFRLVVVEGGHPAGRVSLRPLHLGDLGAKIGQQLGAIWPGNVVGKVQHLHPFQRSCRQLALHSLPDFRLPPQRVRLPAGTLPL